MITCKFTSATAWLLLSVQLFSADTIVLISGEKIDGRVVREDGDKLVLEVNVSDTIKDERIVLKSEVRFIEKEKEETKVFNEIAKFVPTPDLLGKEAYEERIRVVDEFIEKFPASLHVSKAEEMLDTLNEELGVIEEGGFKLGEELILVEDYNANAYQYDAIVAGKKIDEMIGRGEYLKALRLFSEYEEAFGGAAARGDLVERIRQVLAAYGSMVDDSMASFETRMKKREAGLESMSLEDRTRTARAIEDEKESLKERLKREKDARVLWVTPDANHLESLQEARRQIDREIKRLETGSRKKGSETPLGEAYSEAWSKLSEGIDDEKEMKKLFDKLKSLRMPDVYVVKLRERAGMTKD